MKFPILGIPPGINFKASRQNIFKVANQTKCFAHIKFWRKEAKQYQIKGQTGVGWGLEGGRGWIILIQNNSLGGRTSQHLGKEEMGLAKTPSGKAVTEQGTQEKRQFS